MMPLCSAHLASGRDVQSTMLHRPKPNERATGALSRSGVALRHRRPRRVGTETITRFRRS